MGETTELANYLLISFKAPKEQEYIEFLWDTFETNYTHDNYLSRKDIHICLGFHVAGLITQPEFESISALHKTLKSEYGTDDDRGAL